MSSKHRCRLGIEPLEDRRLLTITVNTLVDENNGVGVGGVSLREAVVAAAPGEVINFSVNGTINLTSAGTGEIVINKNLTIQGPGANLLTVKAFDPDAGGTNNGNGRRVFLVTDSDPGTLSDVVISGLTLSNGDPPLPVDENDGGGAIRNGEKLTLSDCVLSGNYSPNGGAIYNTRQLTLNDCTISGNDAGDAAAVLNQGGSLTINRSAIANNVATNSGGGILSRGGLVNVTVTDSSITGNLSDEYGGGIYLDQGSLSVSGTTISDNAADANHDSLGSGGGIYNLAGQMSLIDSTISGNSAGEGGGGVFSNTGQTVTIAHSTIAGNVIANVSGVNGGGINSSGNTNLNHTIVAGNLRGATTRDDVFGTFDALYSLIGDVGSASVNNSGGTSLIGTTATPIDAKLAPLANNGGPTLTRALQSGSPAIDAGNAAAAAGAGGIPQFDQRGSLFPRVVDFDGTGGPRIDIGAVEMAPIAPTLPGDYNLNQGVDAADYVLWRMTQGGSVSQPYNDADGDGNKVINANDYTVWRTHFGNSTPGSGSGAGLANERPLNPAADDVAFGHTDSMAAMFEASSRARDADATRPVNSASESQVVAVDLAIEQLLVAQPNDATSAKTETDAETTSSESENSDWVSLDGCDAPMGSCLVCGLQII